MNTFLFKFLIYVSNNSYFLCLFNIVANQTLFLKMLMLNAVFIQVEEKFANLLILYETCTINIMRYSKDNIMHVSYRPKINT